MPTPRKAPPGTGRQLVRQACDGCRVRKIKCSGLAPCSGCTASNIQCTFKKLQKRRGPRDLRPKTVQQVVRLQRQRQSPDVVPETDGDIGTPTYCDTIPPPSQAIGIETSQRADIHVSSRTASHDLDLGLSIFRLRLYPVWPVVEVLDLTATLKSNEEDNLSYALANAVAAATIAQLKLDPWHDAALASFMEAECCRVKDYYRAQRRAACLDTLRIAFFLHVYHENLEPGGVASLAYLREAITLAQIMGLHRESTYAVLSPSEQELRRRILWLLFVTERGVAILHHLPVVLRCNTHFPSIDSEDQGILPAFRKLLHLFWIFEQSGAFDVLQSIDDDFEGVNVPVRSQSSLEVLQQRLQDVPIDWEASNDVQRADICVTRQWMRAVLWKISVLQHSSSFEVTSLSLPIQIAQEFLTVISKLPTAAIESHGPSIEFKIFEIASAVTDALAKVHLQARVFPDNTSDVLHQLHRILMSCRGGNKNLLTLLEIKIAQIQDDQSLFFMPSSSRIEEVFDIDHSRNAVATNDEADADIEDESFFNGTSSPTSREIDNSSSPGFERGFSNSNPWDLFDQLQNFEESFNDFQVFDILENSMPIAPIYEPLLARPSPTLSLSSLPR